MLRPKVLEYARILDLGPPSRISSARFVNYVCPFAKTKHGRGTDNSQGFGIAIIPGEVSTYFCFACHSKGIFHQLAYELSHLRKDSTLMEVGHQIRREEFVGASLTIPKWDDPYLEKQNEIPPEAQSSWPKKEAQYAYYSRDGDYSYPYCSAAGHPYLLQRGISWCTTIKLGLRYDPAQRRILFPVTDEAGRFAGFSGRRVDRPSFYNESGKPFESNGKPYLKVRDYPGLPKSKFFLGESGTQCRSANCGSGYDGRVISEKSSNRRITLVEGLFDFAWLVELGYYSTLGLLGSHLTRDKIEKLIRWKKPVVLFLDNDKAGYDAVIDIRRELYKKIPLLTVEYPEGYEDADPASLPPSVINEMQSGARLILKP